MKAAVYSRTGSAHDMLHVEEVVRPEPGTRRGPGSGPGVRCQPDRLQDPFGRDATTHRRVPDSSPGWSRDSRCRG